MTFELRKRRIDNTLLLIDRLEDRILLWSTNSEPEIITDRQLKELGALDGIATWGINAKLLWKEE